LSNTVSGYMAIWFIFIGWMPFFSPTLDNADQLFALMITPGYHQGEDDNTRLSSRLEDSYISASRRGRVSRPS